MMRSNTPWSWLDDFMQRFSWRCPSARASPFLNNHFLPGVPPDVLMLNKSDGVLGSNKAGYWPKIAGCQLVETSTDCDGDDIWVGEVLSEVELFFKCGRSKISRIEKLEKRGILISNNLEIA